MRKLGLVVAAAVFVIATGSRAEALPFTVAGITMGGFNGDSPGDLASLGPLTFNGNDRGFEFTTEHDPFLGLEQGGTSELGVFSLGSTPFSFSGSTFAMTVHFIRPGGSTPNPLGYSAALVGRVNTNTATGQVTIDYAGPARVTFDTGWFDFFLNDVTLRAGESISQSGYVIGDSSVTNVAEPGSLALFGTGLCLLAGVARRKVGRRS